MKLQAKAKNSRNRVLMGLAVLLAVVTLALFFINFTRHSVPENSAAFEESGDGDEYSEEESYSMTTHLDTLLDTQHPQHLGGDSNTLSAAPVVTASDGIAGKMYVKGTK